VKVDSLVSATDLPIYTHQQGQLLPGNLPSADAAIVWMYSQIILVNDFARYPAGLLNMHGGRIPEFRGANVLQWAIINGETEIGVTWHEIIEQVDAGPIWADSVIPIPPEATAADMRQSIIDEGTRLFPEAWTRFRERSVKPRLPDLTNGKIWRPRRPDDGRISPRMSERQVRDQIRALCPPWPPATIWYEGYWYEIKGVVEMEARNTVPYTTSEGNEIYLRIGRRIQ